MITNHRISGAIALLCFALLAPVASAESAAGEAAALINKNLPPGTTIASANEPDLLQALKLAAAESPDLAPEIGAAAVRGRLGHAPPADDYKGASDGKEVVDYKGGDNKGSASPLTEDLLTKMALAIIEGAAADPAMVNSILAAMAAALPPGSESLITAMTENVLTQIPPIVQTGLLELPLYNFTAPPNLQISAPVLTGQTTPPAAGGGDGDDGGGGPPPPIPPNPIPVTPFQNL